MTQALSSQAHLARRSTLAVTLAAALVAAGAACSPAPEPPAEEAGAPVGDPPTAVAPEPAPPLAILSDGTEIVLELAITPEELAQGLMYRPRLPENRGMLLIFSEERQPSIWMLNTLIALDLVYLDSRGVVVDIIPDAQPCPGEPCPHYVPRQPARAVLEIPAGTAARYGLGPGQEIDFVRVPGFPEAGGP